MKYIPLLKEVLQGLLVTFVIALAIVVSFGNFLWTNVIYSWTLTIALAYGNGYINDLLDRHISWIHQPVRRLLLALAAMFGYSLVAVLLIDVVFIRVIFVHRFAEYFANFTWQDYLERTYFPLGITVVITTFLTSRSFLLSWREAAIEAERLKTENMASKYESLRSQVNPHFLFNSLNALTALVYEDPDMAARFIKKLSEVYRYVLDTRHREVVSLQEELAFLESYIFLQKIRYENNLQINLQLPRQEKIMIPPLSLQMLLENAIKHNEISEEKPLHIALYLENDEYIVVSNKLQKKNIRETSSGIGLENIKLRYEYLTKKVVEVLSGPEEFTVKLPLLVL